MGRTSIDRALASLERVYCREEEWLIIIFKNDQNTHGDTVDRP